MLPVRDPVLQRLRVELWDKDAVRRRRGRGEARRPALCATAPGAEPGRTHRSADLPARSAPAAPPPRSPQMSDERIGKGIIELDSAFRAGGSGYFHGWIDLYDDRQASRPPARTHAARLSPARRAPAALGPWVAGCGLDPRGLTRALRRRLLCPLQMFGASDNIAGAALSVGGAPRPPRASTAHSLGRHRESAPAPCPLTPAPRTTRTPARSEHAEQGPEGDGARRELRPPEGPRQGQGGREGAPLSEATAPAHLCLCSARGSPRSLSRFGRARNLRNKVTHVSPPLPPHPLGLSSSSRRCSCRSFRSR